MADGTALNAALGALCAGLQHVQGSTGSIADRGKATEDAMVACVDACVELKVIDRASLVERLQKSARAGGLPREMEPIPVDGEAKVADGAAKASVADAPDAVCKKRVVDFVKAHRSVLQNNRDTFDVASDGDDKPMRMALVYDLVGRLMGARFAVAAEVYTTLAALDVAANRTAVRRMYVLGELLELFGRQNQNDESASPAYFVKTFGSQFGERHLRHCAMVRRLIFADSRVLPMALNMELCYNDFKTAELCRSWKAAFNHGLEMLRDPNDLLAAVNGVGGGNGNGDSDVDVVGEGGSDAGDDDGDDDDSEPPGKRPRSN